MNKNEVIKEVIGEIDRLASMVAQGNKFWENKCKIMQSNMNDMNRYKEASNKKMFSDLEYTFNHSKGIRTKVSEEKLIDLMEVLKSKGDLSIISLEQEYEGKKNTLSKVTNNLIDVVPLPMDHKHYESSGSGYNVNGELVGKNEITDEIAKEKYISYFSEIVDKVNQLSPRDRQDAWDRLVDKIEKIETSKNVIAPHRKYLNADYRNKEYQKHTKIYNELSRKNYECKVEMEVEKVTKNLKSEIMHKEIIVKNDLESLKMLHEEITYADEELKPGLIDRYNSKNIQYNGDQAKVELINKIVKNNQEGKSTSYNDMLSQDYNNYSRSMEENNVVGPIETIETFETKRSETFNNTVKADTLSLNEQTNEMEYFVEVGNEKILCKEEMTLKEYHNLYTPAFEEKILNGKKIASNESFKEKFINKTKDLLAKAMNKLSNNPRIPFMSKMDSLELNMDDNEKTL